MPPSRKSDVPSVSLALRPLLRDLRVSAALLLLSLLPSAAMAFGRVPLAVEPAAAGRTRDGDRERRNAASQAYIIHLPGIAGPMRFDRRFAEGLVIGQAGSEFEIFDWVGRRRGFGALYGVEENRRQARRLADHIIELKKAQPQRALVITAHSGGTAIVAWALEMLGEEATERRSDEATKGAEPDLEDERAAEREETPAAAPLVDGVIFIASGLSSEYDLSPMLRQVRGRVLHLSSSYDNLILAAGTAIFGTLDRKNGLAAGKTGFYLPEGVAPETYARFVEVPYDRSWVKFGHYGDHEGMMTTSFATKVGADLVRSSLGVEVELPTTRPAVPAPPKPVQGEIETASDAPSTTSAPSGRD